MASETLLKTDKCTLVIERLPDGKIRLTTAAWEDGRTLLANEVLELRSRDNQVHLLRKPRLEDEEDRRRAAHANDPYPGMEDEI